jgi:hypothetical protein
MIDMEKDDLNAISDLYHLIKHKISNYTIYDYVKIYKPSNRLFNCLKNENTAAFFPITVFFIYSGKIKKRTLNIDFYIRKIYLLNPTTI